MSEERTLVDTGPGTRVEVDLDWDAPEAAVLVHEVRTTGPCDGAARHMSAWQHAATYGARFALSAVTTLPCAVHIVTVEGDVGKTNATAVAAATASAVWEALEVRPEPELIAHLEEVVRQSWSWDADQLCPFRLF